MFQGKRSIALISIILLVALVLSSINISCIRYVKEEKGASQPTSPPKSMGVTGTISTGTKVDVVTTTVSPSGGTVTVAKPGDPLDGLKIEVPPGAYTDTRTFKVSYAPIQNHTFGQYFKPLSPLITVENGGGYAEEVMLVKIPVKIPKGHYAMGFFYDEKNGRLEGMPLASIDGDSITVATWHFSKMSVCDIDPTTSRNVADSGFRVGNGGDNWQMPNHKSWISCGSCLGMCITAQWYYEEKALKGAHRLYGYYDNNGNEPKTRGLWEDDSLAMRLVDEVQVDYELHAARNITFRELNPLVMNDLVTYWLLDTAIRNSRLPQLLQVNMKPGWHQLLVYMVESNLLHCYDPNDPDRPIQVQLIDGKFKWEGTGKVFGSDRKFEYDRFAYTPSWTFINPAEVKTRWDEFYNKTIGQRFPKVQLKVKSSNSQWVDLVDGYRTQDQVISIALSGTKGKLDYSPQVYDKNGRGMRQGYASDKHGFLLGPGKNLLGILISDDGGGGPLGECSGEWVDFKWINVYSDYRFDIAPLLLYGEPGSSGKFTAPQPQLGAWRLDWSVNGVLQRRGTPRFVNDGGKDTSLNAPDLSFTYVFPKETEGDYKVTASLYYCHWPDKANDPNYGGAWEAVAEASAQAIIKAAAAKLTLSITPSTSTGEPNKDYKFTAMTTNPPGEPIYEWYVDGKSKGFGDKNWTYLKFDTVGRHEIMVTLVDNRAGSTVGRASAVIEITGVVKPKIDLSQCKRITFRVKIDTVYVYSPMRKDKLNASFFIQDIIDGEFSGNTFTGSRSVVSSEKYGTSKITFTLDPSLGQLTSFSYFCTDYRDYLGRPMWADLEITGRSLPRFSGGDDSYWLSYQVEDKQTCDHLGVKGTYYDRSYSVISEVWCGKGSDVSVVFQKR